LAEVKIQDGETVESALRRFKRKVLQEDIIKDIKRHAFDLKPGQKKRVKAALARERNRKKRAGDGDQDQIRSSSRIGPSSLPREAKMTSCSRLKSTLS
jgi:small subunit ribosomal protein S21